jgi:uncharacterized protein (TIGR02266 family)
MVKNSMAKPLGLWARLRTRYFKTVSERRKYPRVPISVKATNLSSGSFTYYLALNISVGGVFLKADEPLGKGTPFHLKFILPDQDEIEAKGVVVRIQEGNPAASVPSGMGVQFTEISTPALKAIEAFIAMKT